ncbi:M20 family metallopeptidase [Bradyrhizobium sp. LHD-71]|uniref:M20 family metallopeptidase n=1 Tax=Bradyrhizobium sp. LHD-71 TaxID=3072141 RepID=UPI00280DBA06|nr:M20 family metallopeptidase [Bradyrhizobium sp. LHD-71]MDQ8728335.1 M20 family metallopeptidase [Bradyrhizobium sp. LHD-71]
MTRQDAIARATRYFDSGTLTADLARRVAFRTESKNKERAGEIEAYLRDEIAPFLDGLGFSVDIERREGAPPFLFAQRLENDALPTVLGYGHGDVVDGMDQAWEPGLSPWTMTEMDGRFYGRGTADNKGQHTINLAALQAVLETRGRLGFNAKFLFEMGEERGSPGLRQICADERARLAADLLIASDGPRLKESLPTIFLGSRGSLPFDLVLKAREREYHSGNWGGALANPAIQLAHAIGSLVGPTGQVRVDELKPPHMPQSVRQALGDCVLESDDDGPEINAWWGEPGLTPAERVFGWSSLEVLAFEAGNPASPVNAIPSRAWARMQLRFVDGVEPAQVIPAVRAHLLKHGFGMVDVRQVQEDVYRATRLAPDNPWVDWAVTSILATTGKKPTVLPNFGGTLPNDCFADILKMPTLWIPHSYPACAQHAPNEHLPRSIAREGLAIMAGLYWDLGERS